MSGPQMMSVYAKGRRTRFLTAGSCIRLTVEDTSQTAVGRVALRGGTAIATIDGHVSVIKQREEGDEKLSFDALFDEATSEHDVRRMARHKVDTPAQIGKSLYVSTLILGLGTHPRAVVAFAASDDTDAPQVLRRLLGQPAMREELLKHMLAATLDAEDTEILVPGHRKVRETLPPGFTNDKWLFIQEGVVPEGWDDDEGDPEDP